MKSNINFKKKVRLLISNNLLICILFYSQNIVYSQEIRSELKQWHKVVIDFSGPSTSESADPNPFTYYRLDVTFISPDGRTYRVPGYYTADGNAAETSSKEGNIWRVCFTPDQKGKWRYKASFRKGEDIAISSEASPGSATAFDGASGSFKVTASDKKVPDFRAKGTICYVGKHYLQHAGSGEYFLKGGADSPENFLAYEDFDDTYDSDAGSGSYHEVGTFIHQYTPHLKDWQPGDPIWKNGKGKAIIGMLNYLSGKGMNSVYFLTYNIDGGDGRDVWMWTSPDCRDRFDCSKLDQWEIVFSHMDKLGIMLHVLTQEQENDDKLGGSSGLNPIRRLYYRELIARFGHHLAVVWNVGEENKSPDKDRKAIARFIRGLDVYEHPITIHTRPHNKTRAKKYYNKLFGDPFFDVTSVQARLEYYNEDAIVLRKRSAQAGHKWAIFADEQNPAGRGVLPDDVDPDHDLPRKLALWGNLMGGGSGVEWYFGHRFPNMDIDCENWRSRDRMWDQTRYALDFFQRHLPFTEMVPCNDITTSIYDYCFVKIGEIYAIYLPYGGSTNLIVNEGNYSVQWYNPRTGGELLTSRIEQIKGPGSKQIGYAPYDPGKDWVVLVRKVVTEKE
jgi:hypothetical protein